MAFPSFLVLYMTLAIDKMDGYGLIKPGAWPSVAHAWFLEITLVRTLVCVCVCVYVSTLEGINNQWSDMV